LEAFVSECVRKQVVSNIQVPAWVFEAFGKPVENRNFNYDSICDTRKGPNYWGTDSGYPGWKREEAQMWYYYSARRYIDAGFEAIHLQDAMEASENIHVDKVLTKLREYAKSKARRGLVLFHNFFTITSSGSKIDDRLLFDINGNGLVPLETVNENGVLKARIYYLGEIPGSEYGLTWFGRSGGGQHPLGFYADICPTLLELDNYGLHGTPGVSNGPDFGTWGYDDISWYALQPSWYRDEWLRYLDDVMKKNCLTKDGRQAYFPLYPMRRSLHPDVTFPPVTYKPGKSFSLDFLSDYSGSDENVGMQYNADNTFTLSTKAFFRANRQSDGCPNGFGQEDIIRELFLGKNAPEDPRYNTVVLPEGYKPDKPGNPSSSHQQDNLSSGQGTGGESRTPADESQPEDDGFGESSDEGANVDSDVSDPDIISNPKATSSILPVILGMIGAIVLAGGGVTGFVLYRKKKALKDAKEETEK